MTEQEIKDNAPHGATHYYQNEVVISYFFYSSDVNLWFTWNKTFKHWTSGVFKERIDNLKPL